ncbi:choice-of-anchor J domain-containing protein [Calditrichota bacterium GD2]
MRGLILSFAFLFLSITLVFGGVNKVSNAILDESFESGFPPSGWTKFSDSFSLESWQQSSEKSRTGSYSALAEVQFVYPCDIWLVTPALDLSGVTRATLYFYEDADGWESGGGTHYIAVSTTSPSSSSSFTTILEMTPSNHTIEGFSGGVVEVDLSAYAGQSTVYVGFHYSNPGSPNYQWYIDDVKVVVPSDHDVMAFSLDMDAHYAPNTTVQPMATVKNEGKNTETFDVEFGYYDWNDNPVAISTKTVTALAPGAKQQVTFDNYTFAQEGYTFYVKTLLSTDQDASNDLATKFINSYASQKEVVLPEEFTDTECKYCPGAAEALDSLYKAYPNNVAIIAYHGGFSGNDPFDNSYASARRSYYGVSAYPTCYFGGDRKHVGGASAGSDWSGIYAEYEAMYQAERQEYTPFTMDIAWTENGTSISATATVTYESVTFDKNLYIRWALCESHIAYNWETSMDSLHFVERLMIPDANGTKLWGSASPPSAGDQVQNSITFDIPADVVKENCELIAFVQNDDTKEVMVAAKVDLGNPPSAINQLKSGLPQGFYLAQNYPNPFNPFTSIRYDLPQTAHVELAVYDLSGKKVMELVNAQQNAGSYEYRLNAADLASGVYIYMLKAGNYRASKKMILLR